jgi:hypothetical protein
MAGDALSVVEVEVAFGRARVLDRLSLEVAALEFVALLGPSDAARPRCPRHLAPGQQGRHLPAAALHLYPACPEPAHEKPDRHALSQDRRRDPIGCHPE